MTNGSAKPINDARLAALEELSALDQELELTYGLTGNPMIKAQERTQPTTEQVRLFTERLLATAGREGRVTEPLPNEKRA